MPADTPEPRPALPARPELDVLSHAPIELEHLLHRLDQYETPLAVVDESCRVVEANGPWLRRAGGPRWCAVGEDLAVVCSDQAQAGDPEAERLMRELQGVLRGRTQFCEWDAQGGEHVSLARLVAVSGNYALAAFRPLD